MPSFIKFGRILELLFPYYAMQRILTVQNCSSDLYSFTNQNWLSVPRRTWNAARHFYSFQSGGKFLLPSVPSDCSSLFTNLNNYLLRRSVKGFNNNRDEWRERRLKYGHRIRLVSSLLPTKFLEWRLFATRANEIALFLAIFSTSRLTRLVCAICLMTVSYTHLTLPTIYSV